MRRYAAVLAVAGVTLGGSPLASAATINDDPKYWKVESVSLCRDTHKYEVRQILSPGSYFIYDKIRATWDRQTMEALEQAEGGKAGNVWVKRKCQDDPWRNPAAKAACVHVAGSSNEDNLLPFDIAHPVPPQPSQIPAPTINSPWGSETYLASGPVTISVEGNWKGSFCGTLALTMTAPKGQFSLPLLFKPTNGLTTTWQPQGWAGGGVPEGVWTLTARTEVYDGAGGTVKGQEASRPFYVGAKPQELHKKISVVSPGSPSPLMAPAYDFGELKQMVVEVQIHKELYDVMSPRRVGLTWKPPWAMKPGLPGEIVVKTMFSPSSPLRVVKSATLDFSGQPPGMWELRACVRTEWGEEACAAPSYFTLNSAGSGVGGGGGGGGGQGAAASSPARGAGSASPAGLAPAAVTPSSLGGARTPGPSSRMRTRAPVGAPQLQSASARGTAQAILSWAAPAGAVTPETAVEIRSGAIVVGRGTLKALEAGERAQLTVSLALPRGTALPADLAIFAGATRVGSVRVGEPARGR